MRYVQNRDIKRRLVNYLRQIYKLNHEWLNADLEVIELTDSNSPQVHEQYPWDKENYPIVVIGGTGSQEDDWAIDSYIQNTWRNKYIGSAPRDYVSLNANTPVALGVKVSDYDYIIRNISVALKQNTDTDYDIDVFLMSSSNGAPATVLASGSIAAEDISATNIVWGSTEFSPILTLSKDTEYFVKLSLTNGSYGSYYLMVDDSPDDSKTPFARYAASGSLGWSVTSGITPLALMKGPVYQQLGGGIRANYSLYIEAKDLASVQKISELTYVYLKLLKHANIKPASQMTYPNTTSMDFDRMSNLADLGISIISVNKGNESVRERGNDRIFSIPIELNCYGYWTEVFEMPTLQKIEEIIGNY